MFNSQFSYLGPRPPCGKGCKDREAGCQVRCEKWAEYVKLRNEHYEHRRELRVLRGPTQATEKSFNRHVNREPISRRKRR